MPKNLDGLITYLFMPLNPGEAPVIGETFGCLHEVNFVHLDLANFEAFPELAPKLYLDTVHGADGVKFVPQHWVRGLAGSRLLNLLRMPHFRHYNITDWLARQLLALIHDGCLWIQDRIPIDVVLVHQITGLPMSGPNPLECVGKKYEVETPEFVCQKYHVDCNTRGFIIKTISDQGT